MEKDTKLGLLEELKGMLEEPGEIPTKAQKVTVMAKDKEGLEEGLEKAKDVVEELPMHEEMEGPEHEAAEGKKSLMKIHQSAQKSLKEKA